MSRAFLTAEWRFLAMLNYRVPADVLTPFIPAGTEIDLWNGDAYVSIVGFHFRDTRLLGLAIPFHRTFEEVNLRLYVRRTVDGHVRRGVSFVRELVPRAAIAVVAQLSYNEPYLALPMRHTISETDPVSVEYEWQSDEGWSGVSLVTEGPSAPLREGSEEEFITQHLWGYTRQRDGSTIEYEVEHPRWNVWHARSARLIGSVANIYPSEFAEILRRPPDSAFLADGSAVTVFKPERL